MWFRLPMEEARFRSSIGREFTTYRAVPRVRLWVAGRKQTTPVPFIWDTAADLLVFSEAAAVRLGIPFDPGGENITTFGVGGPLVGILTRVSFQFDQIDVLRGVGFVANGLVLLGSASPVPLLGNLFVRRNFDVQTAGERRTFFRLREHAPDAIPAARLASAGPPV